MHTRVSSHGRRSAGRLRATWQVGSALLVALGLPACGIILGIEDGVLRDGGTQDAGHVRDARGDRDGGTDVGTPPDTGERDAGHIGSGDASALPDGTFPPGAVYVSPQGTDSAGCGGSVNTPCRTIQTGIVNAEGSMKGSVVIAPGTYTETLTLMGRIQLLGPGDAGAVTVVGAGNQTVVATLLERPVLLANLTIRSKPEAGPGESLYGVFASENTALLELDNVRIVIASSGSGAPGGNGVTGATSSGACQAGSGADGGGGSGGMSAVAGGFTASGYEPASGITGGDGGTGANGSAASTPPCAQCFTCNQNFPLCTTSGMVASSCGGSGTAGCGGGGGGGGRAGSGGGSSVALFLWNTAAFVDRGRYQAGSGGNGGSGGPGGPGGPGGAGASGLAGSGCTVNCFDNAKLACGNEGQGAEGAPGGNGGSGGPGGPGGGGAGGSSYGVYIGGTATMTNESAVFIAEDAGAGALGAPSGQAAAEGPL